MGTYTDNILFDEGYYLSSYPDVLLGIQYGVYENGLDHWEKYGRDNCYIPNKYFNESNYLHSNPHLVSEASKTEHTCVLHHWLKHSDLVSILAEYSNKGNPLNHPEIKYLEDNLSNNNSLDIIAKIFKDQISEYNAKITNSGLAKISEIVWNDTISENIKLNYAVLLEHQIANKINNNFIIDTATIFPGIDKCYVSINAKLSEICSDIIQTLAKLGELKEVFEQELNVSDKTIELIESLLVEGRITNISDEERILSTLKLAIDKGYKLQTTSLPYFTDLLNKSIFIEVAVQAIHQILETEGNLDSDTKEKLLEIISSDESYNLKEHAVYSIGYYIKNSNSTLADDGTKTLSNLIQTPIGKAAYFTLKAHIKNGGKVEEELQKQLLEYEEILENLNSDNASCGKESEAKTEDVLWKELISENNFDQMVIAEINSILAKIKEVEAEKKIHTWLEDDIVKWSINPEEVNEKIAEVLAVIKRAMFLSQAIEPRLIQVIATLLIYKGENGRLAQIATGEGKSVIVAMLTAIKVLEGNGAEILTSSPILAERDSGDQKKFYQLLGITNGDNTKLAENSQKEAYKQSIVYGDITNYIGDLLRHEYMDRNIRGDRKPGVIVVDEVDNMCIDQSSHIVMLSSLLSRFEFLQPLLVAIWGRLEQIVAQFDTNDEGNLVWVDWQLNLDTNKYDKHKEYEVEDHTKFIHGLLVGYINKLINGTEAIIKVPVHLKAFAKDQVDNWASSAIVAYNYESEKQYTFTKAEDGDFEIAPIDFSNTGIIQTNTELSDGLHQFLEIKHNLKISSEKLTITFMSNKAFFERYKGKIFGMTGTLGTTDDRALLSTLYGVDSISIPTFKPKDFTKLPAVLANDADWENAVIENVKKVLEVRRAVLLIAETVFQAESFKEILESTGYDKTKIKLYSRNDDLQQTLTNRRLEEGEIIIATNLAGRGTDLKTSCDVEKRGGLHVCLSYLPDNYRVEAQALGRTARQGNSGSGQLIINTDEALAKLQNAYTWYQVNGTYSIDNLMEWRNLAETQRLLQDKVCQTEMMTLKDNLFKEFGEFLKKFKHKDKDRELYYNAEVEQSRELWGLWLKDQLKLMECNITDKLDEKSDLSERNNNIKKQVTTNFTKFKDEITEKHKNSTLIINPSYLTIRGLETNSLSDLNRAIELDPDFSFAAHYVKANLLISSNDKAGVKEHLHKALDNINNVIIPLYELPISLVGIQDITNNELPLSKQFRGKINILTTMAENIVLDISIVESAMGDDQIHLTIESFTFLKDAINNYNQLKDEANEISALGIVGFYEIGTIFIPEEDNSFFGNVFAFVVGVFQIVVGAALAIGSSGLLGHLSVGIIVGGIKDVVTTAIATAQGQRIDIGQYFKSKGIELAVSVILAGIQTGIEKLGIGESLGFKKATPATLTERLTDHVMITGISSVAKQALKVGLKKNQREIEESIRKSIHSMLQAHKEELNKVVAYDEWSNNKQAQKKMLAAAQYMLAKDYQGKYRQAHQQILRGVAGGLPVVGAAMTGYDIADTLNDVLSITDDFCDKLGSKMHEYAPSDKHLMNAGLKSKEGGFGSYDANNIISTLSGSNIFSDEILVSGSCSTIPSMELGVFNKQEEKEKIKEVCEKVDDIEDLEFEEQTEKVVNDLGNMITNQIVKMVRNGIFSPIGDMIGSFTWGKFKEFQDQAKDNINKNKEGSKLTPEQEESFRKAETRDESVRVAKEYYEAKNLEVPIEAQNAIMAGLKAKVVDGKLIFENSKGERVDISGYKENFQQQKEPKQEFKQNKQ
ncbi:hypothetical protein H1Q59_08320, partial [Holosporaceae bacterium 'Namur']|nr:hypothetical protein [Holosporaceae bacterium 'Namur']